MFNIYIEMIKDCIEFCNKAETFIEKQKEFMEEKDDGKTLTKVQKSGNY